MNPNNPTQDLPDVHAGQSTNPTQQTGLHSDPSEPTQFIMPIGFGYVLRDVIGKGGMGIVYQAYDVNMRREVAVKILQDKFAPDSSTAVRFIEEAQITGQLQHPGIPAVYQVSKLADGRPFLAMKLIKGDTLETLLKEKTPINVLGAFEAICQAVGYAHAHDVIHRDLKPANIMVGAFGEVQVMDWGLAKVLASGGRQPTAADSDPNATTAGTEIQSWRDSDGSFTQAGSVMGTPGFMPPEQAGGEIDKIDQRADVFGLGAILCNLLTGEPPYSGANAESVRQKALRGKTEDAFAKLDSCGAEPEVVALCKQCLAFEPDERPRNANAIAGIVAKLRTEAEERAKQAEICQAKAEVAANEQRKRRRLVQIGAAIVAVVLVAGIIGTLIGLQQARTARDAESARANGEAEAKREVEQQKAEVERKREEVLAALKLANERTKSLSDEYGNFVFGIQNKLANQPGTQELRRELLTLARNGLKKILDEARKLGNPDSTVVWSYFRMGDVEQQLGNTLAAQKEYQAGYELAKQLADADPKNALAQRDLSISYEKLGNVMLQLGQTKEALEFYQRGLTVSQRLAEADPKNALAQRDLSFSYNKLGDVTRQLGQTKEALELYQKSLTVRQRLAEADPKNAQGQRDLAISFEKLGSVH
jgi:serine/threonine protein kinase